jgi:hypothetical protein
VIVGLIKLQEKIKEEFFQREFLQRIKDRPFTPEERADISSRLDLLEGDINRVW